MPKRQRTTRLTLLLLLMLALLCVSSAAQTDTSRSDVVRIGLVRSFRNVRQVTVNASSCYSVFKSGTTEKLATLADPAPITIAAAESQLSLIKTDGTTTAAGNSLTVVAGDPSAVTSIDAPGAKSKQYRGKIEVSAQSSGLLLVNIVDIEDYLPGVLVGEMPSSFPEEALKSQAVAARCYTLCARGKHSSAGYDLCDSVHCQVYDGCLSVNAKLTQAVLATKGRVLTYKGKIASVMYHGDCGGATQCYADVYGIGSYPYLCGVREPAGVGCLVWEKSYTKAELAQKLIVAGIKEAEGLQKLTITKTSSSGRVIELAVAGEKATATITGARLRSILGTSTMRSTLFTVEMDAEGTTTFKGKGSGHGIGMSQMGAKALSETPFNYSCAQILEHYFPGTTLSSNADVAEPVKRKPDRTLPSDAGTTKTPKPSLNVRVREPKL